jgi:hypothetical protein
MEQVENQEEGCVHVVMQLLFYRQCERDRVTCTVAGRLSVVGR